MIKSLIRTIPHYPKPGIMFRDITTLLGSPVGLKIVVEGFIQRYQSTQLDKIASIEARGFIVGAPLAYELGLGLVPVRKQGKLPAATVGLDYELEYGNDRVEIHADAIAPGDRVLVVDDLIATGGTAEAAVSLIRSVGATVDHAAFVIDLPEIGGGERLRRLGVDVHALCEFEGE